MKLVAACLSLWLASGCAGGAALHPPPNPPTRTPPAPLAVLGRPPTPSPEATEEVGGVEAVALRFVELLRSHQFSKASTQFDRAMSASLPSDRLESAWSSVESGAGTLRRVEVIESVPRPPRTHVWFACEFDNRSWNVEVVVNAASKVSGLRVQPVPPPWQAPAYADQQAFVERAAKLGEAPFTLDGVLTVPARPAGYAAVLVHGSGPQDEDASVGPRGAGNKMFKDLAWGLATRGIAVLRYPKRTWAHPEQFEGKPFTLDDEVTGDACLAVREVAAQSGVSSDHVLVVAHSLGAAMAPRIASACPSLGGLVMMAGPSRSLDKVLFDQFQYLLALAAKSRAEIASEMDELLSGFSSAIALAGAPEEQMSFSGMRAPRSYWVDVTGYDPARAMGRAPRVPVLVLQGGRDYQVRPAEFESWKRILRAHPGAAFRFYPALDHRFVSGEGLPTPADYGRPGHVAPEVIADIAGWIVRSSRSRQ